MTEKVESTTTLDSQTTEESSGWIGLLVGGRYRIERLIARGGMAVVYLADDIQLHRQVALKVLVRGSHASAADFEERFRREAQALAGLAHPNIVTLYDYGETEDGHCYLAMEYVAGPRFTDLLKHGPMDPIRAMNLVHQVCQALRYAHKRGVVHRDLKPSNLLIQVGDDGSERVKVVDFGLVKLAETDQSLTQPGLVLGSPHCMSPEQVQGLATDGRTDIYAVGILLFRAITGVFPFHGDNGTATMLAHLHRQVPPFFEVAPNILVPEGLEALIHRCLAKEPSARFADMQGLMEALAICSGTVGAQINSVSMVRPSPPHLRKTPNRRLPLGLIFGGLAAAALLLLGIAGWAIWWSNRGPAPLVVNPSPEASVQTGDARTDTPKVDTPKVEAPAEPPKTVAPAETPRTEAPLKAEAPKPPKASAPKTEAPKTKTPEPPKTQPAEPSKKPAEKPPEGYMPLPDDF